MESECHYESRSDLLDRINKLEAQLQVYGALAYTNGDFQDMSGLIVPARAAPSGSDPHHNYDIVRLPHVVQPQMGMRLSQDLDTSVM